MVLRVGSDGNLILFSSKDAVSFTVPGDLVLSMVPFLTKWYSDPERPKEVVLTDAVVPESCGVVAVEAASCGVPSADILSDPDIDHLFPAGSCVARGRCSL